MTQEAAHIVPYRLFVFVWLALVVLTGITVGVTRLDLGIWKIWAALGIASIKAGLVIFFFMHLKYEKQVYWVYFFITLVILALFIGLTFADVHYRSMP